MGRGQLSAAFRGLARNAAEAGQKMADAVAKAAEKTAAIEEKNVAALLAADARAAKRLEAVAAGRGPWQAATTVVGPAKGKALRSPNKRHTISGARSGQPDKDNTVTLRGYEHVLKEDTAKIAAGKATFHGPSQLYEVDGRTYRVKDTGTVFPVSGPGLVELSRNEYMALQKIARAGGDVSRVREFEHDPAFLNNPEAINKAKAIYDGTYTP
jgi:hypothetical protein